MDWKKLLSDEHDGEYYIEPDVAQQYQRSGFEKEYHYIISSPSFRRLQDKTQVFPLDNSDFVRTRLTHSIETSSLARTLGSMVTYFMLDVDEYNNKIKFADIRALDAAIIKRDITNILMCAGLLHDIGNPPFGHFGETAIQDWFKENLATFKYKDKTVETVLSANPQALQDLYHFEGNAQALRLLTKLHFQNDNQGLHLTYALLNTLIKYPTSSENVEGKQAKKISKKKMGFFQSENDIFQRITEVTGTGCNRHPLTFLLEAADDIAYATADLEDAFKKGLIGFEQVVDVFETFKFGDEVDKSAKEKTNELLKSLKTLKEDAIKQGNENPEMYAIRNWIPEVQFWFLYSASYAFTYNYSEIISGNYEKELLTDGYHKYTTKILKKLMNTFVYPSSAIEKLEIAAHSIITGLLQKFVKAIIYYDTSFEDEVLKEHPEWQMRGVDEKLVRLISDNYINNYHAEASNKSEEEKLYLRLLLVTDFICGMSDSYAKSLYQELEGIY